MPAPLALPDGLVQRPLTTADAGAVTDLIAAQEVADVGEAAIEEADIVADWQRPGYDVTATSVGVLDGDRLVAYAEVGENGRSDAAVHPEVRGRGIGTALAGWMRALGAEHGHPVVGMPVPQGSPGDRLLGSLGWQVRWNSWVLRLPAGETVPVRALPEGYAVRQARPEEWRACWTVNEDAFLEWSKRPRDSFEAWSAAVVGRPGFEPWNLRVVVDPAGEVVAVAFVHLAGTCGYISRIATRADQRGRGLAQALLVDAFATATEHGATLSELNTDSRTGALGLYERVGMQVACTWVNRAIGTAGD